MPIFGFIDQKKSPENQDLAFVFLYLIQRKVPNLPEVEKEIVSEIRIIFFHLPLEFLFHV